MRIAAWKCRKTGKVFQSREKFAAHLLKLRETSKKEFQYNQLVRYAKPVFRKMTEACETGAEIEQFIRDNWETFVAYSISEYPYRFDSRHTEVDSFIAKFPKLLDVQFNERFTLYNHATLGTVYKTRIKYVYQGDCDGTLFKNTPIKTGSGGGMTNNKDNTTSLAYECYFPLDKWPAMGKRYMYQKLNGEIE